MSQTARESEQLLERVPLLQEIVERLVRRFDPLRIILFGSWARGDIHRWSDIDLLLVLSEAPFEEKLNLMTEALNALSDLPVAKDVIVTDPEEIKRRGNAPGTLLRPALQEGTLIYERR